MRPSKAARALSTTALTSASSVTSQAATWASRPSARTSAATCSSGSVSRAVSTTSAPSRASVVVMAAPMPFAAPVTIAFLPSTFTALFSCLRRSLAFGLGLPVTATAAAFDDHHVVLVEAQVRLARHVLPAAVGMRDGHAEGCPVRASLQAVRAAPRGARTSRSPTCRR